MKFSRSLLGAVCLLSLGVFCASAHADVWIETTDAGETLITAQTITGTGSPLTSISGSIFTRGDVDLFRIYVSDFTTFSATTSGNVADPRLYLFDSNGVGIAANDDDTGTYQSSLPVGNALYAGRTAGSYYLGMGAFRTQALDGNGGVIFSPLNTGVIGPSSTNPLGGFETNGPRFSGTYSIGLTGVTAPVAIDPVPEPGEYAVMGMVGLTICGLMVRARRPRVSAGTAV